MNINWQDVVTTVASTVGGTAVLLAAAAWLIRTVLTNRLALDAEKFKAELKANADMEMEKLKHSLQRIAVEHQVRFSKLHEKRAEVIADLYRRLSVVFWDAQRFVLTGGQGARGKPRNIGKPWKLRGTSRSLLMRTAYFSLKTCASW